MGSPADNRFMADRSSVFLEMGIGLGTVVGLIVGFPPWRVWPATWVALVPFLWILRRISFIHALRLAFFIGVFGYGILFYWFLNMSRTAGIPPALALIAMVGMAVYTAFYFVVFALGTWRMLRWIKGPFALILPACLWTILEWARHRAFSGFGWAALSHSQIPFLPIVQWAEFTGEFGISFFIVLFNTAVAETLHRINEPGTLQKRLRPFLAAVIMMGVVVALGAWRWMVWRSRLLPSVRIGLIQPNIPQILKWDERFFDRILQRQKTLTESLLEWSRPALVIWPESSFPDVWQRQVARADHLGRWVSRLGVPLLLGAITQDEHNRFHNTALLLDETGRLVQFHHKRHLVPFGEYLPGRKNLGWLADLLNIEDFAAGEEWRLFTLLDPNRGRRVRFGVLICFEDTVGWLGRDLVRQGAQFLVNITNDGWFGDSIAPQLHYQAAVYRALENRRSLVRAANTGVSVFIDPTGERLDRVENAMGREVAVAGFAVGSVRINESRSFYTKYGDVFTGACLMCILIVIGKEGLRAIHRRRRRKAIVGPRGGSTE